MKIHIGQRLLATLMQTKFENDAHSEGHSTIYTKGIADREPEIPWKAEVYWAFWCNKMMDHFLL